MFVWIGYGRKVKDDIWLGKMQCPNCGQISDFRLKEVKNYVDIFWIPVISKTSKRLIACDCCNAGWEKPKAEYEALRQQQQQKLEQGTFPDEVVAKDYAPGNLHKGRKIGLLVAAIVWGFVILTACALMLRDMQESGTVLDGTSIVVMLIFAVLGCVPFIFAIRSMVKTSKLEKIYNFYAARYRLQQSRGGFPGGMQENR